MSLSDAIVLCASLAVLCWVLSVLTREHSWVDRAWSIAPVAYVAGFAAASGWSDARLNLMAAAAGAWGARLTFNFARKGGYLPGGEDYRWAVLRRRMAPWQFALFNMGFIAAFQNVLLLLLALPAWAAQQAPPVPLGILDGLAAACFAVLLVTETVADEQQWRFHQRKAARARRGEPGPGFLSEGLFRYSRHPNFFAEIGIWWAFYLFSVTPAGWWNVGLLGPAILTLLFQGSTALTESLSAARYPEYADYRRRTSRLLPLPPRR